MVARAIGSVVACLALAACARRDYYSVVLEPTGDSLQRRLECWREEGSGADVPRRYGVFDAERLAEIARAYGEAPRTSTSGPNIFQGVFSAMPADVGGFGRYHVETTSLGSRHVYAERFLGEEPTSAAERRTRATGVLVDALVAWCRSEMGSESRFEALERFLRGPFRDDLVNAMTFLTDHTRLGKVEAHLGDGVARLALYLEERGYEPALVRMIVGNRSFDSEAVRRRVAREMGVPEAEPIPASLAFLSADRVEGSWKAFVQRWRATAPPSTSGEPSENPVGEMFLRELGGPDFGPLRHLRVSLSCPVTPSATNGTWQPEDRRIEWGWESIGKLGPPTFRHATWSVPDVAFQQSHFGTVALVGDDLGNYVEWRILVRPDDGKRWDGLLAGLNPRAADVTAAVAGFGSAADTGWVEKGRTILVRALEKQGVGLEHRLREAAGVTARNSPALSEPETAFRTQIETFKKAISLYYLDKRQLPASLEELTRPGTSGEPFLSSIPRDPWGDEHEYVIVDARKRAYTISSRGPDKISGTADDLVWNSFDGMPK
jgi:hypothetical protein